MTRYPVVATRRRRWPWTGRLRLSQRGRGGRQAGEARETAPGSGGRRSKRSTLPRRRRWDRAFLATAEQFRSTLRTQESLVVEEDVKPCFVAGCGGVEFQASSLPGEGVGSWSSGSWARPWRPTSSRTKNKCDPLLSLAAKAARTLCVLQLGQISILSYGILNDFVVVKFFHSECSILLFKTGALL